MNPHWNDPQDEPLYDDEEELPDYEPNEPPEPEELEGPETLAELVRVTW